MLKTKLIQVSVILAGLFVASGVTAATFRLPPPGEDIIGKVHTAHSRSGEALWEVGRRYDIGIDEMIRVNPGINPLRALGGGRRLVIPSQFILPPGPREGIVINLAELRLYYYPPGENVVITEPVGIGKEGWQTPVGTTKITTKRKNPWWRPTASVRAEAAENGHKIPKVFPPGPNNPLGRYAMNLGWPTYLIHSTNRPDGVGGRVSAGCIRMYPEDIRDLFAQIAIGTPVRVISEPFKVGWHHNRLYLEAHEPLTENSHKYEFDMAPMVARIYKEIKGKRILVKWRTAQQTARGFAGIPKEVGRSY